MQGRVRRLIAWICVCVFAAAGAAVAAALQPIPQATSLLVDQAGALTTTEREILLSRLKALQNSGRAQVGILISTGTGGEPLAEYSLRVAESWKLGRAGRDDGLLILVIPSPAAVRLEVGYGLEGYIPDARASQWIDELLPAMKENALALGLERLLNQIDTVLPKPVEQATSGDKFIFDEHPEWGPAFALVVFSLLTIMPLFVGRWGGLASAPLMAAMLGGAAWLFWGSPVAAYVVAGCVFPLPLLWSLNGSARRLPRWLEYLKAFGNLAAVLMFFSIITLFVGVALWSEAREYVWAAPIFAGILAIGVAVFLFPSATHPLMVVLRSACHFVFILVVVLVTLQPFMPNPTHIAFAVAAGITALIAIGLYLDSRESARPQPAGAAGGMRASHWFFGLALLLIVPLGIVALILAIGGEDLQIRITQAAAGGGSIGAILMLAAKYGLFAAVKVGLGGKFGGGGAER